MKNAIVAAIVAALVASTGGFAAGNAWNSPAHERGQDARIAHLELAVQCLTQPRWEGSLMCAGITGVRGPR